MELNKVMQKQPALAKPETTVIDAVKMMAGAKIGALVIVNAENKVQGIFTECDNLRRVTMPERDPKSTSLAEVMTAPVVTSRSETQVDEALSTMIRNRFSCLPVVDADNTIVGVVSLRDMLMRRLSEKEASLQTLEALATAGGPG